MGGSIVIPGGVVVKWRLPTRDLILSTFDGYGRTHFHKSKPANIISTLHTSFYFSIV